MVSKNVFLSVISSGILLNIFFKAEDFLFSSWKASSERDSRYSTTERVNEICRVAVGLFVTIGVRDSPLQPEDALVHVDADLSPPHYPHNKVVGQAGVRGLGLRQSRPQGLRCGYIASVQLKHTERYRIVKRLTLFCVVINLCTWDRIGRIKTGSINEVTGVSSPIVILLGNSWLLMSIIYNSGPIIE